MFLCSGVIAKQWQPNREFCKQSTSTGGGSCSGWKAWTWHRNQRRGSKGEDEELLGDFYTHTHTHTHTHTSHTTYTPTCPPYTPSHTHPHSHPPILYYWSTSLCHTHLPTHLPILYFWSTSLCVLCLLRLKPAHTLRSFCFQWRIQTRDPDLFLQILCLTASQSLLPRQFQTLWYPLLYSFIDESWLPPIIPVDVCPSRAWFLHCLSLEPSSLFTTWPIALALPSSPRIKTSLLCQGYANNNGSSLLWAFTMCQALF